VNRSVLTLPALLAALLAGCWTPPNANIEPQGPARIIQKAIRVTAARAVTQELTVYISRDGRLPGSDSMPAEAAKAKVLLVDRSYRLLSLQYPDGRTQTFKVGLDVKLAQMQPGDDVMIQPLANDSPLARPR
jgi:hypothetical protein